MKKLKIFLMMSIMFLFIACNGNTSSDTSTIPSTSTVSLEPEDPIDPDSDCIIGDRIQQGTGIPICGDSVEPPIQPYPDKYDCGTDIRLVQGTADTCVESIEVDPTELFLPTCGEGERLVQGSTQCMTEEERCEALGGFWDGTECFR